MKPSVLEFVQWGKSHSHGHGPHPKNEARTKLETRKDSLSNISHNSKKHWKMPPLLRLNSEGEVGGKNLCSHGGKRNLTYSNSFDSSSLSPKKFSYPNSISSADYNPNIPEHQSFRKSFSLPASASVLANQSFPPPTSDKGAIKKMACPLLANISPYSSNPRLLGSSNIFAQPLSDTFSSEYPTNCKDCFVNNSQGSIKRLKVDDDMISTGKIPTPSGCNCLIKMYKDTIVKDTLKHEKKKDVSCVPVSPPAIIVTDNIQAAAGPVTSSPSMPVPSSNRKKKRQSKKRRKRRHKKTVTHFYPPVSSSPLKDNSASNSGLSEGRKQIDVCAGDQCSSSLDSLTVDINDSISFKDIEPGEDIFVVQSDSDEDLIFESESGNGGCSNVGNLFASVNSSKFKIENKGKLVLTESDCDVSSSSEIQFDNDENETSSPITGLLFSLSLAVSEDDEDDDDDSSVDWECGSSPCQSGGDPFFFEFEFNSGLSLDSIMGQRQKPMMSKELCDANLKWNQFYSASKDDCSSRACKKVYFASEDFLATVHLIGNEDRKGEWYQFALERAHFKKRIEDVEKIVSPILAASHRQKVRDTIWGL